jgi:hypothetical protein
MRNRIWSGAFATIVGIATVGLTAQTTPPPQTTAAPSSENKVTVTGCLQAAPAGMPGATGTSGTTGTTGTAGTAGTAGATAESAGGEQKFLLVNAMPSPTDPTSPETGSTTAPSGSPSQTYRLIANATALSPHVGKKVELTGTIESSGSSASTTTSSDPSTTTSAANAPALRVEAGKVLTAPCSQ